MKGLSSTPVGLFTRRTPNPADQRTSECVTRHVTGADPSVLAVDGLLTAAETDAIVAELDDRVWVPTGPDGVAANHPRRARPHSLRCSFFDETLARRLFERLAPQLPTNRRTGAFDRTDTAGATSWEPVAVNTLFRVIRYLPGGHLVGHYDAPFHGPDGVRSLTSLVICIERHGSGGATRFLHDPQVTLPHHQRDFSDRHTLSDDGDVAAIWIGGPSAAVMFDHRVLHDATPATGTKTVIRSDVMWAARP